VNTPLNHFRYFSVKYTPKNDRIVNGALASTIAFH
jgi:hypothetical protein